MHPVLASNANTSPSAVPTYRRPPTTTGCVPPEVAPGYPNAHFSFNRGTASGVKPADVAELKRVFVIVAPQLFHAGAESVLLNGVWPVQNADAGIRSGNAVPNFFSDKYSARIRLWARLRSEACVFMAPVSRTCKMCSGVICFKTS